MQSGRPPPPPEGKRPADPSVVSHYQNSLSTLVQRAQESPTVCHFSLGWWRGEQTHSPGSLCRLLTYQPGLLLNVVSHKCTGKERKLKTYRAIQFELVFFCSFLFVFSEAAERPRGGGGGVAALSTGMVGVVASLRSSLPQPRLLS